MKLRNLLIISTFVLLANMTNINNVTNSDSFGKRVVNNIKNFETEKNYDNYQSSISTPLVSKTYSVTTLDNVVLYKGIFNNNDIRLLKQELNKVMNCKLEIIPEFDDNTYDCVIDFQKKHNLETNGIVDSKIISELNKVYKYQQVLVKTNANIRKSSNISSDIIATVLKGTRLNIIANSEISDWIKVEYNDQIGYIRKDLISLDFVEIDITSQVLRYYKNGNLYMDTIIATGKYQNSDTPKGMRNVVAKYRKITLQSTNTYVEYWIATDNRGYIGIHDASWRGGTPNYNTYGGNIYKHSGQAGTKYSGSHGCINTPKEKVSIIYDNISVGTPIYIY